MNSITGCHFRVGWNGPEAASCRHSHHLPSRRRTHLSSFPFSPGLCVCIPCRPLIVAVKKRAPKSEPILKPSIADEEAFLSDEEDELLIEDFEGDELLDEDDFLKDDSLEEDTELFVGDGAGGGGISLAGTPWDKKALEIAQEVALSFGGEMGIYAFRTLKNAYIQVRVERLTNKSGSPSMMNIEAFSSAYRERLDEAESLGSLPNNLSLEVSSPGVDRVVRIPEDLNRFKDRPMRVKYTMTKGVESCPPSEHDGVFMLVSFDAVKNVCTWGLADARVNREKAGKGRPLSKKQKEWRLDTPIDTLVMVRLHSEF